MKEVKFEKGLDEEKVRKISELKNEPEWMLEYRLKSYKDFTNKPLPSFGPKINIDFNNIKNDIRERLGKYFYVETECKPMIIAVIQEI